MLLIVNSYRNTTCLKHYLAPESISESPAHTQTHDILVTASGAKNEANASEPRSYLNNPSGQLSLTSHQVPSGQVPSLDLPVLYVAETGKRWPNQKDSVWNC